MNLEERFSKTDQMHYMISAGQASVTHYEGDAMQVIIPETLEGCPVTKIESYAFSKKQMRYVQFPETLTMIDHHGFSECHEIKQLTFPDTLKKMGNYAFYNCWSLECVHLKPAMKTIGYGAFKNCEKLNEIVQDMVEGQEISIGSILDDLSQEIHVIIRHLYNDKPMAEARVLFTEHDYEMVPVVASMCKQYEADEIGSGKYMRYCISNHDVDYWKYDGMFHILLRGDSFDTIITVAIERLMYPYMLTIEGRERYHRYIGEHAAEAAEKYIREDNLEKLTFLVNLNVLDAAQMDTAIDLAIQMNRTEFTAFLMDYKQQHFKMSTMAFEL